MASLALPRSVDGQSALDVAIQAAEAAADQIRARLPDTMHPDSKKRLGVATKGSWNDRVTEVDSAAEAAALSVLTQAFPEHVIAAEESGLHGNASNYKWYLDPIDGTRNFASGLPHICTSIGLWANGAPLVGVLLDPIRNETFASAAGEGATINRAPVSVSTETDLGQALLGFDMGYKSHEGKLLLSAVEHLWPSFQSVRMMGSAALGVAYSGCGRLELYAHHYVQPWDIAAAILFATEAGGLATDLAGRPLTPESGSIVCGAPLIHAEFMARTVSSPWRRSIE